jgi:hypothetical protein
MEVMEYKLSGQEAQVIKKAIVSEIIEKIKDEEGLFNIKIEVEPDLEDENLQSISTSVTGVVVQREFRINNVAPISIITTSGEECILDLSTGGIARLVVKKLCN